MGAEQSTTAGVVTTTTEEPTPPPLIYPVSTGEEPQTLSQEKPIDRSLPSNLSAVQHRTNGVVAAGNTEAERLVYHAESSTVTTSTLKTTVPDTNKRNSSLSSFEQSMVTSEELIEGSAAEEQSDTEGIDFTSDAPLDTEGPDSYFTLLKATITEPETTNITVKPETATTKLEITTREVETFTEELETTTKIPDDITEVLRITTEEPNTTTDLLKATTHEPKTTTEVLKTTSQKPKTTTEVLKSTTQKLKTTTEALKTTTQEPKTATEVLKTTTERKKPETSTEKLETSTEEASTQESVDEKDIATTQIQEFSTEKSHFTTAGTSLEFLEPSKDGTTTQDKLDAFQIATNSSVEANDAYNYTTAGYLSTPEVTTDYLSTPEFTTRATAGLWPELSELLNSYVVPVCILAGAVVLIVIIVAITWCCCQRKRRESRRRSTKSETVEMRSMQDYWIPLPDYIPELSQVISVRDDVEQTRPRPKSSFRD